MAKMEPNFLEDFFKGLFRTTRDFVWRELKFWVIFMGIAFVAMLISLVMHLAAR